MKNPSKDSIPAVAVEAIKDAYVFHGLSDAQINQLAAIITTIEFDAGDYIMREGDKGGDVYILLEGEVAISKLLVLPEMAKTVQKMEKALIRLTHKYHPFFGEMSIFEKDALREASIRAVKKCRLAKICKSHLLPLLEKDPRMGMIIYRNIAAELVSRLRKANKDILKLTTAFSLAMEG